MKKKRFGKLRYRLVWEDGKFKAALYTTPLDQTVVTLNPDIVNKLNIPVEKENA